jgi:hypothetical protein
MKLLSSCTILEADEVGILMAGLMEGQDHRERYEESQDLVAVLRDTIRGLT